MSFFLKYSFRIRNGFVVGLQDDGTLYLLFFMRMFFSFLRLFSDATVVESFERVHHYKKVHLDYGILRGVSKMHMISFFEYEVLHRQGTWGSKHLGDNEVLGSDVLRWAKFWIVFFLEICTVSGEIGAFGVRILRFDVWSENVGGNWCQSG